MSAEKPELDAYTHDSSIRIPQKCEKGYGYKEFLCYLLMIAYFCLPVKQDNLPIYTQGVLTLAFSAQASCSAHSRSRDRRAGGSERSRCRLVLPWKAMNSRSAAATPATNSSVMA